MGTARFITGIAIASLGLACSGSGGGSGGVVTAPTEAHEPGGSAGAPESPGAGSGQESPGPGGNESPGSSGAPEQPGSSSGSASSSSSSGGSPSNGGACSFCNKTYSCTDTTSAAGTNDQSSFTTTLNEVDGQCVASATEDGGAPAVFSCNGTITAEGQSVSWTADGAGGFTFSESVSYTVNGSTQTTTVTVKCDPATATAG